TRAPSSKGARGARSARVRGRGGGQRRAASRTGLGRARRPVYQDCHGDRRAPTAKARRPSAGRDRDRRRVPDPIAMSPSQLRRRILGRRSVRARIALACAGLFLVTGGAFVAATYTLVVHRLPSTAVTNPDKPLMRACTMAENNGTLKRAQVAKCKQAFADATRFGAANQRAYDLHALLLWSLVGLGVATIVTGFLGWAIGRR